MASRGKTFRIAKKGITLRQLYARLGQHVTEANLNQFEALKGGIPAKRLRAAVAGWRKGKKVRSAFSYIPKGATEKEIYAILRRKFSAADLPKFSLDEKLFPVDIDRLLAEPEQTSHANVRKPAKKTSHA